MSDLYQDLKAEFKDPDYRYGYAESFLNTKLATQIKTLREQRGKTQAEVAALMGIKQPGYRRFEDVNHSVWKTDALWNIARALGVRLNISFETFGSLMDDKKKFTKKSLERPSFEGDPAFSQQASDEPERAIVANARAFALQRLATEQKIGDRPSVDWEVRLQMAEQVMAIDLKYPTPRMTLGKLADEKPIGVTGMVAVQPKPQHAPNGNPQSTSARRNAVRKKVLSRTTPGVVYRRRRPSLRRSPALVLKEAA